MRRVLLMLALMLLTAPFDRGQSTSKPQDKTDIASQKIWLLFELQNLESDSATLNPLPRAVARAEISDAAWTLDQAWAKKLLREAYELTFPDEVEQDRLRSRPVGAAVTLPSNNEIIREEIRNRILNVASRDKVFADELAQLSAQRLGKQEEQRRYASLASQAVKAGDTDLAGKYINQAFNADPTLINVGFSILDVAVKDRAAADKLIVQYIDRLRQIPLSLTDQSAPRVFAHLYNIVFPSPALGRQRGAEILPTGPTALKAYVGYVIESLTKLEQAAPGSARFFRNFLVSTWLPLKQYAPELMGPFMELEKISREPGMGASLPQENSVDKSARDYERVIKNALDSGYPDDYAFMSAFGRDDFAALRKMIDLLPEGEQKAKHIEFMNLREAISLAGKGDILGAEKAAIQLKKAASIQQAYPAIIVKCVAKKDAVCVASMAHQATKQLKGADDQSQVPLSLSRLAKSVVSIEETLALEMLDEAVQAANSGNVDTTQGRAGIELDAFRALASKSENRVREAAANFKDKLQRITALASIYQWKTKELAKREKPTQAPTAGARQ
jgi:hypothetical protein